MTAADKMFCSHIPPACSLITAQLPVWSHAARDQEHNREAFPFKPAITRFKALIWHKRTQKQRDTLIHLLSFCRLGSAAGCRDETSAEKWLKYKMRQAENLSHRGEKNTKLLDGDFGCSRVGWRSKVKAGGASRVTFAHCPQVRWICCRSSADAICLICAGKGGWGVVRVWRLIKSPTESCHSDARCANDGSIQQIHGEKDVPPSSTSKDAQRLFTCKLAYCE